MPNDLVEIDRQRQAWVAAVNGRAVADYVELLTEDVVWFPPGQHAFQGRAAFQSWLIPFFESYTYEFAITEPVVTVAGSWAVERGAFHSVMTSLAEQKMMQHGGDYLIIWRKDDDGVWRIERYIDETAP